jgi:adenylate cyclase
MGTERIARLFDWLVDGAPGANTAVDVIMRMGDEFLETGIPVDRMGVFVTTLHPTIVGRAFWWEPGIPVKVLELTLERQRSPMVMNSPVVWVSTHKKEYRHQLEATLGADEHAVLHELKDAGYTDFFAVPLQFLRGETHVITFSTKRPGGFTEDDIALIRHVARPLARVTEIFALHRTAANLLSTYVGHKCGPRILAGRIFKGDIETIRAVIWFSDLRGFTAISATKTPREIIDMLNELFDCQVPAIEKHGGEVLKFIGDGLFAIFPVENEAAAVKACADALEAADQAFAALEARNAKSAAPIQFGLALHIGEFGYGNIGGSSRLDFTAIGPAINITARLEGLTGKLGRFLVVSQDLAKHATRALEDVGTFELKGVPEPQRVFSPPKK